MNASCHTHEKDMLRIWTSHVSFTLPTNGRSIPKTKCNITQMKISRVHTWRRRVPCMNKSCLIHEWQIYTKYKVQHYSDEELKSIEDKWAMPEILVKDSRAPYNDLKCTPGQLVRGLWLIHVCDDMTFSHVCRDFFTFVTWLIHVKDSRAPYHVLKFSWTTGEGGILCDMGLIHASICVLWLIRVCVMTQSIEEEREMPEILVKESCTPHIHDLKCAPGQLVRGPWLSYMCAATHSHVCHDSFTCVPWLIHMCAMTHSHVCHDSFTCVPWLIHMYRGWVRDARNSSWGLPSSLQTVFIVLNKNFENSFGSPGSLTNCPRESLTRIFRNSC